MKKKIIVASMCLFIGALSAMPLFMILTAVDVRFVGMPSHGARGTSQAIQIVLGHSLILFLALAWLGFLIYIAATSYRKMAEGGLFRYFALIAAITFYLFPLTVLMYHVLFPQPFMVYRYVLPVAPVRIDWLLGGGGLLAGSILLCLYRIVPAGRGKL